MDYEQKYNEALERARKAYNTILPENRGARKIIEDAFPELAESEDERIRKEIRDFLIDMECKKEWIAHMEKRKESLHITETCKEKADSITDEDERIRKALVNFILYKAGHLLDEETEHKFITYLEKQKEPNARQRLAEWSKTEEGKAKYEEIAKEMREEMEKEHQSYSGAPNESSWSGIISSSDKDKNLDEIAQDYVDGVKEYNPEPTWDLMQTAVCYGYHYCEQKEQKPEERFEEAREKYQVEWSEEDERMMNGIRLVLESWDGAHSSIAGLPSLIPGYIDWLKSLRPQPIQLKEAYREGFQTARHAIALAFMNYCDKIRPNGKMCLSNGECEEIEKAFLIGDWEKIERYFHKYQWRPSKEQMEALKKEADKYWEVDGVDPLYTLWQDLQKLQNQGRGG